MGGQGRSRRGRLIDFTILLGDPGTLFEALEQEVDPGQKRLVIRAGPVWSKSDRLARDPESVGLESLLNQSGIAEHEVQQSGRHNLGCG